MTKIIEAIELKDAESLERINYEILVLKQLISFFTNLCNSDSKKEMLDKYIFNYKKELEQDFLHMEMLKAYIAKEYLPEEFDFTKNKIDYSIDWDKKEIIYNVK